MKRIICALVLSTVFFLAYSYPAKIYAQTSETESNSSKSGQSEIWKEIKDGFDWRLKTLAYGIIQDPIDDSPLN